MCGSNKFAFPVTPEVWATHDDFCGMALRDYFAAAALPQVMAIMIKAKWPIEDHDSLFALMAYRIADAMLAARDAK